MVVRIYFFASFDRFPHFLTVTFFFAQNMINRTKQRQELLTKSKTTASVDGEKVLLTTEHKQAAAVPVSSPLRKSVVRVDKENSSSELNKLEKPSQVKDGEQ